MHDEVNQKKLGVVKDEGGGDALHTVICTKSKVHTVWTIDEVLELLSSDAFTHFPDAERWAFRTNRAEAVVIETSLQVVGDCIIPASARSHCFLSSLPPLLGFPSPKLMVNVEELRSHQSKLSAP